MPLKKINVNYACCSLEASVESTLAGDFTFTTGDFVEELFTLTALGLIDFTTRAFATLTALGLTSLATDDFNSFILFSISIGFETTVSETD